MEGSTSEKVVDQRSIGSSQQQSSTKLSNQTNTNAKGSTFTILLIMGLLSSVVIGFLQFYYLGEVHSQSNSQNTLDLTPSIGYEKVTYNSLIKLTHTETKFKLHSQEAKYGSGSGQQVVSGMKDVDDPESFWLVYPSSDSELLPAGAPIKCGDSIALRHTQTNAFLHSHHFPSPLSGGLEVSGFGGHDTGDSWKVICTGSETQSWLRETNIKLQHVDTGHYLASNGKGVFPHPISGQLEVYTTSSDNKNLLWNAQEGIYFPETKASV